jgi:hypothetical protein
MKQFYFALALMFTTVGMIAQTIVSTNPENKKVILEEFTGIYCVYCPQGHAIAQAIQDANPGEVFLINIHTGGYANPSGNDPDYRTPFGAAIAAQSNLVGYPAGTVNRHYFPGSAQNGGTGTAMSRGAWTARSNETLGLASYLNMAVEAEIDIQTNEMIVHVEAFYTGSSPESTNKLNVALLQNNTFGPQTGGNAGNQYRHMHRLIHMITGQWGDDVSPTTAGSFIDRTYTYSIPPDHNGIPIEILDLELVVFMTETTQEVISGNGATPMFTGITAQNDAAVESIPAIPDQCGFLEPVFELKNYGNDPLTSVDVTYSVNGEAPQTYTWTGNIPALYSELVTLPGVAFDVQATNSVEISVEADEENNNNTLTQSFNQLTFENTNTVNLILNTDAQGQECTWEILDGTGAVVAQGGPYSGATNVTESFNLPGDCYKFNLRDSGGNGGESVVLYDSDNNVIFNSSGDYGTGAAVPFQTEFILDAGDEFLSQLSLYPNPTNGRLQILNAQNTELTIYDVLGKVLMTQKLNTSNETVDLGQLLSGTYFVALDQNGQRRVEKVVKI